MIGGFASINIYKETDCFLLLIIKVGVSLRKHAKNSYWKVLNVTCHYVFGKSAKNSFKI